MTEQDFKALVALKIKYIRAIRNINQKDLAKKAGVSRILLNRLENGKITSRLGTYYKLAMALEVDVDQLFGTESLNDLLAELRDS